MVPRPPCQHATAEKVFCQCWCIDDNTLQLVDRAYQVIHQCEQRFKASIRSTGPAKVYTGKRGKPAFDINEEQLTFGLSVTGM